VRAYYATALLAVLLAACVEQAPPTWGAWIIEAPAPMVSLGDLPPPSSGEVPPKVTVGEQRPARTKPDRQVVDRSDPESSLAPSEPGIAPSAAGAAIPPHAWVPALAGLTPESITAMARLYSAAGMTTLIAGTPYGFEPVTALAEWLGALTEMGFTPVEIGLDRIIAASGGACGWRMGRRSSPGPGDPLARVAPEGTPWESPVVRFLCDRDIPSVPALDLAFTRAALNAVGLLGERDPGKNWAGPEQLLADLDSLLPRSERFWLKLAAFRRIAGPWSHGDFPVPGAWGTLRRGDHGPRVARLRRRLAAEGFLVENASVEGRIFDREVRDAVLAYREAYGLKRRSRVDREMLALVSRKPVVLLADLAASMRAGLEKGWDSAGTYVLVNVPAFMTHLYVDGRRVASYRSVVGFSYEEPGGRTPEYDTTISYVDLNPTWTPSAYAVSHELEREARKDRGYWRKSHFRRRGARWVQDPGPWNTMGQVVIAWPNEKNISLHGTNEPRYFDFQDRALSHGCVRVDGIEDLAARILELAGQTPEGGLTPLLRDVVERRIELDAAVPIQVIYDRVSVSDAGLTGFRPDAYGLDRGGEDPEERMAPLLSALSQARKARRLAAAD